MRTPKNLKGIPPFDAILEFYPPGSLGGYRDSVITPLVQLIASADRCLTDGQFKALKREGVILKDQNDVCKLAKEVGSESAGDVFAIQKAVEILTLARLKCSDCVNKNKCKKSDFADED